MTILAILAFIPDLICEFFIGIFTHIIGFFKEMLSDFAMGFLMFWTFFLGCFNPFNILMLLISIFVLAFGLLYSIAKILLHASLHTLQMLLVVFIAFTITLSKTKDRFEGNWYFFE